MSKEKQQSRRKSNRRQRWNSQAGFSFPITYLDIPPITLYPFSTLPFFLHAEPQFYLSSPPALDPKSPSFTQQHYKPISFTCSPFCHTEILRILLRSCYHTDSHLQLLMPFLALQQPLSLCHEHPPASETIKSVLLLMLLNWICLKDKTEFVTEKPWAFSSIKVAGRNSKSNI